jgi:hypothetical protein
MSQKSNELQRPALDYRADGSWRLSPPDLQAEFRAYLAKLGYRPVHLSPDRLKALIERFMSERNYNRSAEIEQILRDPPKL